MLVALTGIVFGRAQSFDFVVYDDIAYVTDNDDVENGLTVNGIAKAFTTNYNSSWLPMPMISHMTDITLYGFNAGGHHTTNILLHLCNVLMLYALLFRTTGAAGKSAIVAALFALHPMHVEPVVWISGRKDVVSMFFMLATFHAYVSYTKNGGRGMYALHIALYVLALMSKAIVVTMPALLFALDVWPLARVSSWREAFKRALEKWPHAVLAVARAGVTVFVVDAGGSLRSLDQLSLAERLMNIPYVYAMYIVKTFHAVDLTIIYERDTLAMPLWQTILAGAAMTVLTVVLLRYWKTAPYGIAGWIWFLASLFPVSGIVSYGDHFFADRYTYLAHIGLFIIFVWQIDRWLRPLSIARPLAMGVSAAVVVLCAVLSWNQVSHWRNSITLFEHAVRVNPSGSLSHLNLGYSYARNRMHDKAIQHYSIAIQHRPALAEAFNNLSFSYYQSGEHAQSVAAAEQAITLIPDYTNAYFNLGRAQMAVGQFEEAANSFARVLLDYPDNPDALNGLGVCLAQLQQYEKAAEAFARVVILLPWSAQGHANLGRAYADMGDADRARAAYKRALALDPDLESAQRGIAAIDDDAGQ